MYEERIFLHKSGTKGKGDYILYWMQQSQRISFNHTLNAAVSKANETNLPLVVCFVFTKFPEAQERHYLFMYEGIRELSERFRKLEINFIVQIGNPVNIISELALRASHLFMDYGYLKVQRQWRYEIISKVDCDVSIIESDVIVPVKVAYHKEAYSAGVLRPKINLYSSQFLIVSKMPVINNKSILFDNEILEWKDIINNSYLNIIKERFIIKPSFRGGETEAEKYLALFINKKLTHYAQDSNNPTLNVSSNLSPYLHFGQISALKIALEVLKIEGENSTAFFEELFVRRELAMNFVYYNQNYSKYDCLPDWSKKTLDRHKDDYREFLYDLETLENAQTHDEAWNSAQKELVFTCKMHSYMRMYWGKKIIEWVETPQKAFEIAIYLNNKYSLDGRDPNSYAGVAWCFGKHDRAWKERSIFGLVRYMNYAGLKRKFNIEEYINKFFDMKIV